MHGMCKSHAPKTNAESCHLVYGLYEVFVEGREAKNDNIKNGNRYTLRTTINTVILSV